jgi:O-antigen ligase
VAVAFLLFVGFYVFAGIWSEAPIAALKYKGLYGLAVLSGFFLAYSIRDFRDLEISLRVLLVGSAIFAAFIVVEFVFHPSAIIHRNRLALWGMNANRVGQTLAPMLLISAYLALYARVKFWRMAGYGVGVVLGVLIMYTGSRGAAGEAVLGCFIISIPLVRQPLLLGFVGLVVGVAVFFSFSFSQVDATERLLDISFDTRQGVWGHALETFREAPIFGKGWVFNITEGGQASSANMHSIYLQTAVETGIVGVVFLAIVVLCLAFKGASTLRFMRDAGVETQSAYLALGICVAVLAHGVIEAGSVRGSTLNGLMFPFAIGLLDRLPEMVEELWASGDEIEAAEPEAYDE